MSTPSPSVTELFTDSWLSSRLSRPVTIRQINQIHDGYTSEVHRVATDHGSFIIKTTSTDDTASELALRFSARQKESQFYRELTGQLQVNTPDCLFLEDDPFILCLDDVGQPLSRVETDHLGMLATAIGTLNGSCIENITGIQDWQVMAHAAEPDMADFYQPALEHLPDSAARDLLRHYAVNSLHLVPAFSSLPQVFSHMDCRPANFALQRDKLVLFDWGEYGYAPAGFDLAYLLAAIDPNDRENAESWILDCYHSALEDELRQTVPFDQLMTGYALSFLPAFYLPALLMDRKREFDEGRRIAFNIAAAVEHHHALIESLL